LRTSRAMRLAEPAASWPTARACGPAIQPHQRRGLLSFHARNIHIEVDLVDQLFNSSEKRLARTLLLLARYGREDTTDRTVPHLSQKTLAEIVGTTRSRVNHFMNKLGKLGCIDYNGGLTVHTRDAQ